MNFRMSIRNLSIDNLWKINISGFRESDIRVT